MPVDKDIDFKGGSCKNDVRTLFIEFKSAIPMSLPSRSTVAAMVVFNVMAFTLIVKAECLLG